MECGHHLPLVISHYKHSQDPSPACHRTPLSWRARKSLQVEGLVRGPPSHLCLPKSPAEGVGWRSAPHTEPTQLQFDPTGPGPRGAHAAAPPPRAPPPTPPSGRRGLRGPSFGLGGGPGFATAVSCLPPPRRG